MARAGLTLPRELERRIRRLAAASGTSVEEWVSAALTRAARRDFVSRALKARAEVARGREVVDADAAFDLLRKRVRR